MQYGISARGSLFLGEFQPKIKNQVFTEVKTWFLELS
jgi:hypothetical protein